MIPNQTKAWLEQFARERSEAAFRELVRAHSPLVFGTALRMLAGDRAAAQDVAQEVFTLLAGKAGQLKDVLLPAWLYRQTCRRAANHVRAERRRRKRELVAASLGDPGHASNESDNGLAGAIDDALLQLPAAHRDPLVLRFYKDMSLGGIAASLGTTEEAARKRVSRALEKLAETLRRRGIVTATATLSTAMGRLGAAPVPTTLVDTLSSRALQAQPLASGASADWWKAGLAGVLAGSLVAGTSLAAFSGKSFSTPPGDTARTSVASRERPVADASDGDLFVQIQHITAGPGHLLSQLQLEAVLDRIHVADIPGFITTARTRLTLDEQAKCLEVLFKRWKETAPEDALDFAMRNPLWDEINAKRGNNFFLNLFTTWAFKDPDRAASWLLSRWSDPGLTPDIQYGTFRDAFATYTADRFYLGKSGASAVEFLLAVPDERVRVRALFSLTGSSSWAVSAYNVGPERLLEFRRALDKLDDPLLARDLAITIWRYTATNTVGKLEKVRESATPEERFEIALGELGCTSRPTKVVQLMAGGESTSFEPMDSSGSENAVREAATAGISHEEMMQGMAAAILWHKPAKEAAAWLDQHAAEGPIDSEILRFLARATLSLEGRASPRNVHLSAIQLGARLEDPQLALTLMRGAVLRLAAQEPDEAVMLLERADVPASLKPELQTLLDGLK